MLLHVFIGASLSGVFLVIALVAGTSSIWALMGAVAAGFLLAVPIAVRVAPKMLD